MTGEHGIVFVFLMVAYTTPVDHATNGSLHWLVVSDPFDTGILHCFLFSDTSERDILYCLVVLCISESGIHHRLIVSEIYVSDILDHFIVSDLWLLSKRAWQTPYVSRFTAQWPLQCLHVAVTCNSVLLTGLRVVCLKVTWCTAFLWSLITKCESRIL